jgi:hypothetical protein
MMSKQGVGGSTPGVPAYFSARVTVKQAAFQLSWLQSQAPRMQSQAPRITAQSKIIISPMQDIIIMLPMQDIKSTPSAPRSTGSEARGPLNAAQCGSLLLAGPTGAPRCSVNAILAMVAAGCLITERGATSGRLPTLSSIFC